MERVGYVWMRPDQHEAGIDPRKFIRGVEIDRLVTDVGGKQHSERPNRDALLLGLQELDTLILPSLLHLASDVISIFERVEDLYCRRVRLISLNEPIDSFDDAAVPTMRLMFALLRMDPVVPISKSARKTNRRYKHGRSPALGPREAEAINQLLSDGATAEELAATYGCSPRTIRRVKDGNHIFSPTTR